jgi:hypothetical protein
VVGARAVSALRPSRSARFRAATEVSRHPDAATSAARSVAAAHGPGGRVLVTRWGGPAGGLAIADARDLEALGAASGGRSLLVAEQPKGLGVAIIGTDGAVRRRIGGPRTPRRRSRLDQRFIALGAGPHAGILVWPLPTFPYRYRASLLSLGPA